MFDTGAGLRNPMFFVGVVENVLDPRLEQRVQVRAFGVHGTEQDISKEDLPWAIVVKGDYDPNGSVGMGLPAVNQWVFGVFLDGRDAQQPMVLGLIPTTNFGANSPAPPAEIPSDARQLAQGSEPESIGQPANSPLARGENLTDTHILAAEMAALTNLRIAGTEQVWETGGASYGARYPFNRVWETKTLALELDSTPESPRIMITNKEAGSFILLDSAGNITIHAAQDIYNIAEGGRKNEYTEGSSIVTIMGHSHVFVRGNKTEEITGNYNLIVRGQMALQGAGQISLNGSEQIQMRAADVLINANVGTLSVYADKELQLGAGRGAYLSAPATWIDASGDLSINAGNMYTTLSGEKHDSVTGNVFFNAAAEMDIVSEGDLTLEGKAKMHVLADEVFITGKTNANLYSQKLQLEADGKLSLMADTVAVDRLISMANAEADFSEEASESDTPAFTVRDNPTQLERTQGWPPTEITTPQLPEPPEKSTSVIDPGIDSNHGGGSGSAASEGSERSGAGGSGGGGSNFTALGDATPETQSAVTPLLQLINQVETSGRGYNTIVSQAQNYAPTRPLVEMTIQEILDWQDEIDPLVNSEAVGMYQIVEDTLRGWDNGQRGQNGYPFPKPPGSPAPLYERAGLGTGDLFNGANQDKMAIQLLREKGLDQFLAGTLDLEAFANGVAGVWAGLPLISGARTGESQYEGTSSGAYNTARTTPENYRSVLEQVRSSYQQLTDQSDGPGATV